MLTTIATPFGRYGIPFGIEPASEIFQWRLHEAVEGLDGVYAIADDILVGGVRETMQGAIAGHHLKIKKPLTRCEERGVKLNKQKEAFKQTELPCTEHLLTPKGEPPKIAAVLNMENGTVLFVVQLILGTVNLAKFLPMLSEVSEPLRLLTKKDTEFLWDEINDRAFNRIEEMVTAPPVLKYYVREKDLVIQCNASEGW